MHGPRSGTVHFSLARYCCFFDDCPATKYNTITLNKLVRQIVVHEEIGEDGVRKIRVEIHFNMKYPENTK